MTIIPSDPYNPLDKRNLAKSVAEKLLNCNVEPLPPQPFDGAGVYAIYYVGGFDLYEPIAIANRDENFSQPIYVGKAVPKGSRKGGGFLSEKIGRVLYERLGQHAESIASANNLKSTDFFCRYLTVDDIWIPLGESLLIEMFTPLWNIVVEGFRYHDPGSGRVSGKKPNWDVLHPGRSWADKLQPGASETRIREMVLRHFSQK